MDFGVGSASDALVRGGAVRRAGLRSVQAVRSRARWWLRNGPGGANRSEWRCIVAAPLDALLPQEDPS